MPTTAAIAEAPSAASTQEAAPSERIHALDSLRAVAMFLGIVLHGAISFKVILPIPWPALDVSRHASFDVMVAVIHGFRMQLFFLLAGFFGRLLYLRLGPAGFAKQRWQRIGVPLLLGWPILIPAIGLIWGWGFGKMENSEEVMKLMAKGNPGIPTAHLWFLEFLLILYALALVGIWIFQRAPETLRTGLSNVANRVVASPARTLLLAALCIWPLWNGPYLGEPEQPGVRLTPRPAAILYYGLFFAVGWLLHARRELLTAFQNRPWLGGAIALAAYGGYGAIVIAMGDLEQPDDLWLRLGGNFLAAYCAWAMSFAMIGIFLRHASAPARWGRYLADSSYWCYLVHIPILNVLQVWIAPIPAPGWLKFGALMAATMAILLVAYEYAVRYTWVGRMLNGPRAKPCRE